MATTEAALKPRQLKDISVLFDSLQSSGLPAGNPIQFRKAVQSFQIVPSSSVSTISGGTPDAVWADISTPTYTVVIKFIQDAETVGAMTDYLWNHAGEVNRVIFVPFGGTGWQADVVIPAPPIGGDVGAWLADAVTFPVRGKPGRTADDPLTPQQ